MALEKVGEMQNRNKEHNNQDMIAYAAGLFDGEGNINYAQYNCKNPSGKVYKKWNVAMEDRKRTRLNSSQLVISYAVFCLKEKNWKYNYKSKCRGKLLRKV